MWLRRKEIGESSRSQIMPGPYGSWLEFGYNSMETVEKGCKQGSNMS